MPAAVRRAAAQKPYHLRTGESGESRVIGTGEVLLIDDTKSKGHVSQAADGKFPHSLFVAPDWQEITRPPEVCELSEAAALYTC